MQLIEGVAEGSIASELQIEAGSKLISVDGSEIEDVFDYRFLTADTFVELEIESPSGDIDIYEIEKGFDEDIGLIFGNGLMDEYRRCSNNCIFCFIDQMPPGMRKTLYFKDDDSRLSFLQGNYITLTNMKDSDIDRIIRYRMSPINISVHTTDPDLRNMMLGNRFAGDALRHLKTLFSADIKMNGQIVLCKGVNDKAALSKTISDLLEYAPVMESVSVVPVGITRFRKGLYPLDPIEKEDALETIRIIEEFQKISIQKHGIHFVHASDELYITAGMDVPGAERYDGYPQLENGVGMVRLLKEEFKDALDELASLIRTSSFSSDKACCKRIVAATGTMIGDTIKELIETLKDRLKKEGASDLLPDIECIKVENDFFGRSVTVSGLVCGCDLIRALKDSVKDCILLIPVNMLRSGEKVFLDDVTTYDVERELDVKVVPVPADGRMLLRAMLGEIPKMKGRQIYEQAGSSDSRTA